MVGEEDQESLGSEVEYFGRNGGPHGGGGIFGTDHTVDGTGSRK